MLSLERLNTLLSGRVGYALAGSVLLAYVVLALVPFRWSLPRRIENGVVFGDDSTIRFASPGLLRTASAPIWLDSVIRRNAFEIHLRLRPYSTIQSRPARIFTISANNHLRNLSIGQKNGDLEVRLRTVDTSVNGGPPYVIPGVFAVRKWSDIDLVVSPDSVRLWVDGEIVMSDPLPERALRDWDHRFPATLGNELTGRRPWLGELARATIVVDGNEHDYMRRDALEAPDSYWKGPKFQPLYSASYLTRDASRLRDAILNFLGFVPLGFLLAISRGGRTPFLFSVVVCATSSLCVEAAQVFFDPRDPSVADWVLNTVGGTLGASLTRLSGRPAS